MTTATVANPDELGKVVRQIWVTWAREQPVTKPSWLLEWDQLDEPAKEVDRRIGALLFDIGWKACQEAIRDPVMEARSKQLWADVYVAHIRSNPQHYSDMANALAQTAVRQFNEAFK